jgi:hypothetical protein
MTKTVDSPGYFLSIFGFAIQWQRMLRFFGWLEASF